MRLLAVLSLVALLLGGCASSPEADQAAPPADFTELELEATATTGVIRGIVVDDAIRPVPAAAVVVQTDGGPRETKTAEDGAFGFDALPAGTYFVQASKPGYVAAQASAEVVAGLAEPPIVKVLLAADPGSRPFFETYTWDGFIECSARAVLYGIALCEGVGNDDVVFDVELSAGVPTFAQGELVWQSTQSLGDELSFNWRRDDTDTDYVDTEGPSPLLLSANATLFEENEVGIGQPLRTVIFTGHNPNTEPPTGGWGVGVQLQQGFTMYLHVFYNFVPPEGWRFSVDGEPVPPG